jgi:hypothetical protein
MNMNFPAETPRWSSHVPEAEAWTDTKEDQVRAKIGPLVKHFKWYFAEKYEINSVRKKYKNMFNGLMDDQVMEIYLKDSETTSKDLILRGKEDDLEALGRVSSDASLAEKSKGWYMGLTTSLLLAKQDWFKKYNGQSELLHNRNTDHAAKILRGAQDGELFHAVSSGVTQGKPRKVSWILIGKCYRFLNNNPERLI